MNLDHVLDDALAGFDDDSSGPPAAQARPSSSSSSPAPKHQHVVAPTSSPSSSTSSIPAVKKQGGRMQFDPLGSRKKGGAASSSSRRPALTSEVTKLQEDLASLVSEWSSALHPDSAGLEDAAELEAAAAAATGQRRQPAPPQQQQQQQQQQQRATSAVLQALAEQTQRTVDQQTRARPGPAAAAAAGGGVDTGEEPQQMNMIVDVVMQHLLSKEVLYQPMKEIMDKYPPWLEKQEAATAAGGAGSSSSSSSSRLSAEDLQRYRQQYDCITRLCTAYETEPGNTTKIMGLLQEMQACGEPPDDIVQEMSSAIAADMPGLGAGEGGAAAGGGDLGFNFDDLNLKDLADAPDLKNCPVQ